MYHCYGFNAGSDPSTVFAYLSPRLVYTKLHELEGLVEALIVYSMALNDGFGSKYVTVHFRAHKIVQFLGKIVRDFTF